MSYGELDNLFEQYFALVEVAVRLPPGTERVSAFREVRNFGTRIDQIAVRFFEQGPELNSERLH